MDKIKDWFLEHPKNIKAFADAQEAFKQAIGYIKQQFIKVLANELREKKYNFPEWHDFDKSGFEIQCDVLSCPENIGIKIIIGIEENINNPKSFFYGFWLADDSGKEVKGDGRQKYLIIVQGALGKGPKDDGYLWYKYFDYDKNENLISLARNESTFIDKCAAEITDSIEILKNSKQFQDCKWLV